MRGDRRSLNSSHASPDRRPPDPSCPTRRSPRPLRSRADLLAWLRSAIAFMGFVFVVERFGLSALSAVNVAEGFEHLHDLSVGNAVKGALAVAPCVHDTLRSRNPELLGKRRLPDIERLLPVTDAHLPLCELAQQKQTVFIGQHLQSANCCSGNLAQPFRVDDGTFCRCRVFGEICHQTVCKHNLGRRE